MFHGTAATVMLNSTCTVLKWLPLKITSQLKQSLLSFNKRSENKRGKKIRELQNKQKRLFFFSPFFWWWNTETISASVDQTIHSFSFSCSVFFYLPSTSSMSLCLSINKVFSLFLFLHSSFFLNNKFILLYFIFSFKPTSSLYSLSLLVISTDPISFSFIIFFTSNH